MSGLARIWLIVLTATTLASRRRPNMECDGICSVLNAFQRGTKQRNASGTTKLDAVETSSTNHGRAVAAATGRWFNSHQHLKSFPTRRSSDLYVLSSEKTGRRYVGSCENLADRIDRHNAGQSKATKHGVRWDLLSTERFSTRYEAAQRERYYKTGRGRDELNKPR